MQEREASEGPKNSAEAGERFSSPSAPEASLVAPVSPLTVISSSLVTALGRVIFSLCSPGLLSLLLTPEQQQKQLVPSHPVSARPEFAS